MSGLLSTLHINIVAAVQYDVPVHSARLMIVEFAVVSLRAVALAAKLPAARVVEGPGRCTREQ